MLKENCRRGMKVIFGRRHGEKTIGIVRRLNPKKAKVEILEDRGSRSKAGEEWGVPYSMMEPYDGETPEPAKREPITFNMFNPGQVNHLMVAAACVYGDLSPENLTCDGELSHAQVMAKKRELDRQLKGIFMALGREVDEMECYEYTRQFDEHNEEMRQKRRA